MDLLETITALVVGVIATATVGLYLTQFKTDLLGPLVGDCPQAIFGFINAIGSLGVSSETTAALINCGTGTLVYLLLPGLGIGWLVAKYLF